MNGVVTSPQQVYCTECRRMVSGYVPRDGDGSVHTFRHAGNNGERRCPGSNRPGDLPFAGKKAVSQCRG